MFRAERGGGHSAPKPHKLPPMRVAPRVTIHAKPKPQHHSAPHRSYHPPAPVYHAPVYHAPQHRASTSSGQHYSSPPRHFSRPSGGGGNGGGGRPRNSGSGNHGNGKVQGAGRRPAPAPKPAPKPKPPSVGKYLAGDDVYQSGLSELMRALQQFKTSNLDSQTDVQDAFKTAMERMGGERTKALDSLEEDFASRGLLNSGLYADSVSDYNKEYQDRVTDLNRDQTDQLGNLKSELTNFQGLNQSKTQDLRLDAIRRRAEQFGIRG